MEKETKITTIKKVSHSGNSLCVFMTNELDMMGIKRGEKVKLTIERVEDEQ